MRHVGKQFVFWPSTLRLASPSFLLSFTAADFQSKQHKIYVVNITVNNTQPGPTFTPASPAPIDNGAGTATNNILRKAVASGPFAKTGNPNDLPGLKWSADLVLNGPVIQGKMYGADKITVGFVQNVTTYSDHGTYVKPDGTIQGTLVSDLEACVARKPILDSRRGETRIVKVWYSGLPGAMLHPALNRNGVFVNSGTISSDDTPTNGPPIGFNRGINIGHNEAVLHSMQFNEVFQLDICAITSDQANTYVREATGGWTFNASGTVANDPANRYPWTKGQGAGVFPPPNGWQPVFDGSTPISTEPTMNELSKSEQFRLS